MEKDLGYRRVQRTGRGSFITSLPKEWVEEIGIERGSEIAFKEQDNSTLLLVPRKIMEERKEAEKPKPKEYRILVESKEDPQSVCRKLRALYVVSAELIRIRFKSGGDFSKHKTAINNLVRNTLLGSEIIDETPNEMTLQILINHPEFPVEMAIRRMAILALLANRDAILALKNMDQKGLIQSVIDGCNDVNRLNLYVVRQLKFGIERNLFKELGFRNPKEFLSYRLVASVIKSIADNAVNIANNIVTLERLLENQMLFLKEPVDEEVYSQILEFNSLAHKSFEESLKALFQRSYEHADKIIAESESFTTFENDLINLMFSKKLDPNVSSIFRLILDGSRRVVEYSRNVAEVTLHRTVEEKSNTHEPFNSRH
jgi:phosphate uptake regulator